MIPYQKAPSPPMDEALAAACRRAIHVVTDDGRVLRAGRAALFVLARIGHPRLAALLGLPPLVQLVELGYAIVARRRRFFARFLFRTEREPDPPEV